MKLRVFVLTAIMVAVATPAYAADAPPVSNLVVRSSLPPGESGTYTATGQAQFELDKNPADFGAHAADQLDYWDFQTKDADFATPTGTPETPEAGVRIYRDSYGVPQVYGDSSAATWFGDGYAAAEDRLFEMDAVRRTAEGTLAELTGPSQVPDDIAERTVFYTPAELEQQLAALSPEAQSVIRAYAAGVEARIAQVNANPTLLPIEYTLLTQTSVRDWTVDDTLALGAYLTRDVAVQGGGEMANVGFLQELEAKDGKAKGRAEFDDFFSQEDPKAAVTIPDKTFSNQPPADRSVAAQEKNFQTAADFAGTLPMSLAAGQGTGASAAPPIVGVSAVPAQVATELKQISAGLDQWATSIHGGSFAFAIAGNRTRSGHAMLVSEPQLDYSYPGLLWESEVHGGGYDARGVNVPGLPSIGIGWNTHVAWGLTTGYSKNVDSFIETTRANPTAGGPPQYLHDNQWLDESCRTETVNYRAAAMGVPAGPALSSKSYQVCRTLHGPVIATTADGTMAHSIDYADWGKDLQTLDGILDWNRATDINGIIAGVKLVTWNENIIAADDKGNIGYWHPGLYFRRANGVDQRFPLPGTGKYDPVGFLTYDEMPHVVDPAQGYVANWNTKPAHGWLDGDEGGDPVPPMTAIPTTTRPAGPSNRVVKIQSLLAAKKDFTPADFQTLDTAIGESDFRYAGYLPLLQALSKSAGLSAAESSALQLLTSWDGRAYAPGAPGGSSPQGTAAASVTDGPAATLFGTFVTAIEKQLFGSLPADLYTRLSQHASEGHQYDVTPMDNLVQRSLRPGYSGLQPAEDYTGGRSADAVVKAALDDAIATLTSTYGADENSWHRAHAESHLTSLTDVVGPTSLTEPLEDRGSWIELVAFSTGKPYAVPKAAVKKPVKKPSKKPSKASQPGGTLAYTGLAPVLPVAGLLLLGAGAAGVRRRRTGRE